MEKLKDNITNYINWLRKFTKDNPIFYDDDLPYKKLNEEDTNNIKNLPQFFETIYNFAYENYISSIPCNYGMYYLIKDNDITYEIGVLYGQGTAFYCKRIDLIEDINCIDIYNIINNNNLSAKQNIDNKFNEIAKIIYELYQQDNIPLEMINQKVDDITKNLLTKEKNISLTKRIN